MKNLLSPQVIYLLIAYIALGTGFLAVVYFALSWMLKPVKPVKGGK